MFCLFSFQKTDVWFHVFVVLNAERHGPAGQGYCQGGFSADFTKVREIFVGIFTGFYIITQSLCFGWCKEPKITQCNLQVGMNLRMKLVAQSP